ncbi:MAG: hypothetical protein PUD93_12070 [Lachnospiraceae bacterium]|nr:hypothetical protein [Lachnospiraceae bacterium]
MQKWKWTLIIIAAVFGITGCSGGSNLADANTISVQKDGSIKQVIVEQFERSYYNVDELSEMAQKKIDQFNNGADNIVCDSIKTKDGKIIVEITYQTGTDYSDFNNRELFSGTVEEAEAKGYSLKHAVAVDGSDINEEQLAGIAQNHVLIVQTKEGEELDVKVYDKILYTSGNVIPSGKKDVYIGAEGEDMLSYIIFQ